ncbi:MAG TPA: PLP-dependent aminotransferase family protein, partial [Polyangiales bacterium]
MKKSARPVGESGGGRASSVGGFRLSLDIAAADGGEPLFLRIARALIADIRRGRLGRGTRLPGSRALAESLCVHRNTVLAADRELLAEGWIASQAGRGTFVSRELREADVPARVGRAKTRPARRSPDRIGFAFDGPAELAPYRAPKRGLLRMLGGVPDLRLVPNEAFARAARRVLRRSSEILGYGDPAGHPRLRSALADMLRSTRGLVAASDDILITRGSQMALSLVARALIRPGDIVAVEAFGYPPAFAALEQAGARLVPIAVDGQGLKVPLLAALVARERVRALYLTPHHQYPTTVQLSPARRLELLALAARERFAVIEDDYDHEFHYEGRPVLPLASSDDAGVVLYIGTLSKVFAPGIRIGYVIAPRSMLAALTRQRF